jgi:hypothetical protein
MAVPPAIAFSFSILWEPQPNEQNTIDVVRLHRVRDEAAIEYDSLHPGLLRQVQHPPNRFHLYATKFGLFAESLRNLIDRSRMNARWKVSTLVERRDHFGWLSHRFSSGSIGQLNLLSLHPQFGPLLLALNVAELYQPLE